MTTRQLPAAAASLVAGTAALLGPGLSVSPCQAAEWSFEPGIETRYQYDDNFRLTFDETAEQEVNELALRPWADFSRRTPRSNLTGVVEFTGKRYDKDGLDTNDSRVSVLSHYNITERQRANLDLHYIDDTTLDSLLEETGIVFDRIERTRKTASPGWQYSFDEQTLLRASLDHSVVTFGDNVTGTGLGDYKNSSLTLSGTRSLSPQTQLSLSLGASRFERDDDSLETDNLQLTIGLNHRFSERLDLGGYVGTRRTETTVRQGAVTCPAGFVSAFPFAPCFNPSTFVFSDFIQTTVTTESDQSGALYNLNAAYSLERGRLSLTATRSVQPNAFSGLLETDNVVVSSEYDFSPTLKGDLTLQWTRSDQTGSPTQQLNRTFIRLTPALTWRLARDWRIRTSYRYTKEQWQDQPDDATANAVTLALFYHWPKQAISR